MRKKIKKSVGLTSALFIYVTVTAIYLLPRNGQISLTEKWLTVGAAYAVVALLYFVLRKQEKMREKRWGDNEQENKNKNM